MHGSLTGIKSVIGGKLPYFPSNFQVDTKITEKNNYFTVTYYRAVHNQSPFFCVDMREVPYHTNMPQGTQKRQQNAVQMEEKSGQ